MKIAVITPRFAVSGVPLAQIRLAEAMARAGHDVDLIVGAINANLTMPPVEGVNVRVLGRTKVRNMLWPLRRYFAMENVDVVFSAEDHLNVISLFALIFSGSRAKFSGSSRVTPYDTYSNVPFTKRWFLKLLARMVMWRANALTCVSEDMVKQYKTVFKNAPHVCAYNIIDTPKAREKMREPVNTEWLASGGEPLIIAAGQLEHWKGFKDLILATKLVVEKRAVKVVIFGEGSLRPQLEQLIARLELQNVVKLPGNVKNLLSYLSHADVFVLSSHVEGMPNVLVEAMLCGCTPVATNCPTGPRELLENSRAGYLAKVGDPSSIAQQVLHALDNPIELSLLEQAVRPFEERAVVQHHLKLLGLTN